MPDVYKLSNMHSFKSLLSFFSFPRPIFATPKYLCVRVGNSATLSNIFLNKFYIELDITERENEDLYLKKSLSIASKEISQNSSGTNF